MRHFPHTLAARCAALAALLTAPVVGLATPAAAAPDAAATPAGVAPVADFDHDGYGDIATSAFGAGYSAVRYGGPGGRHQTIPMDGYRTAARDIDGDGYTDLVAGKDIHWGSAQGLSATATQIPDSALFNGTGVTAGDFDGDGHADLVAGKTDGEWGDLRVLYGPFDRDGASSRAADLPTGRTFEPYDLAAGDVTGDGRDDLVTEHGFEEMTESTQFWKGGEDGLSTTSTTVQGAAAIALGDVDKDGHADLVIRTVPGGVLENLPYDSGTVKVLYGTADGPSTTRTKTITQNTAGVPGVNEDGDQFGFRLTAGDANGDGYADVGVGVAYEDLAVDGRNLKDAGSTVLLKGGAGGLTGTGAQAFHQNTAGVPGIAEAGDRFGTALYLTDTDADGYADLAAGAPGEDTTATDSGAVWVLRGARGGLTASGAYAFNPGDIGAPDSGDDGGALLGNDFQH